ncbi:MAG: hypothetical protein KatS3mg115_1412 [Candidatus Poribacteria bacterium]|nr:MAG: hypothetical protein KatS3mg115_1412 [Candidatus Poribacteria bacterium]
MEHLRGSSSTFRAWRREPWYGSRTTHAGIVSLFLHAVVVLLLAHQWIHRPLPEERPLWRDAAPPLQVAFLSESALEALAAQTGADAEEVEAVVPVEPKPARAQPSPSPRPQPRPEPPRTEEPKPTPPEPVRPALEPVPVPPATPVTTVADLLRPDESALSVVPRPPTESGAPAKQLLEEAEPGAAQEPSQGTVGSFGSEGLGEDLSPQGRRRAQIGNALRQIAGQVTSGGGPEAVDIVFLLDVSGSMENNIHAVADNLEMMMRSFQEKGYDATFGVVKFAVVTVRVFPQTRDASRYERLLKNMKVGGDERALDAIQQALEKVRFRSNAQHRFVLITDEPLKGSASVLELLPRLRQANVVVDVIGIDVPDHRLLASGTGGLWFLIPGGVESDMSLAR